ncbi:hypothetical protein INT45_009074 [Circinella minor]|uniref:Uncharacterized protein n=1 Tax=Circinella minor TaxID=1195481 RepID=A0A8H7RXI8_9FUNG|nr:hypothetical protein INT45_009074 [Circinella minor]
MYPTIINVFNQIAQQVVAMVGSLVEAKVEVVLAAMLLLVIFIKIGKAHDRAAVIVSQHQRQKNIISDYYCVPGVTSFNEFKTVENELMASFQPAARKCGILTGQQEWKGCLEQAFSYQLPAV